MKKYILIFSALVLMAGSGCKSWLDINHTPNNATEKDVTMAHLLPNCEYNMLRNHAYNDYAVQLSQHLTKSGEYSGSYVILKGVIMPQNSDSYWSTFYTINADLLAMYNKAEEAADKAYMGMSRVLFALNTQRLVDVFGGVPYTQAWNPEEYPQPEYDSDQAIYNDLLAKVDEGIRYIEQAISEEYQVTTAFSSVDILCSGNLQKWLRLANTVKLRLLMRMSGVQDVSSAVNAIAGNCLAIDEDVAGNPGFYVESSKLNIFYEYYGWNKNNARATNNAQYMPTAALVDMLRDNNDPRLRVFCDPRQTLGNPPSNANYEKFGLKDEAYIGIPYGQANPPRQAYTCWTGTGVLAGSSDKNNGRLRSCIFVSGAEVGFFLAEAALKGYVPGGDAKAKEYYEAAVTAVMKRHEAAMKDNGYTLKYVAPAITGSAEDAARAYLSQDNVLMNWDLMTTDEQKLEAIGTQKWLGYFGYNSLEAWFELRRMDYPRLTASNQGAQSKLLCRLPYPQTEMNINRANYEKQPAIDVYNSLVFWDLKNEVVDRAELYN